MVPPIPLVCRKRATRLFKELLPGKSQPLRVSFRALAPEVGLGERATHLLHSYPAKLLRKIPAFFLAVEELAPPGTLVVDPFCGSGTVLLEAMCAGYDSLGCDINPLATLISRVKTRHVSANRLRHEMAKVQSFVGEAKDCEAPPVVNLDYWFYPHVIRQLAQLGNALSRLDQSETRDFLMVCFSTCVRSMSLASPRVSVPVRLKPMVYPEGHPLRAPLQARLNRLKRVNVLKAFERIAVDNINRVDCLRNLRQLATARVLTSDKPCLRLDRVMTATVKLPDDNVASPYLGARKLRPGNKSTAQLAAPS